MGRIGRIVDTKLQEAPAVGVVPDRSGAVYIPVEEYRVVAVCYPSFMGGWIIATFKPLREEKEAGDAGETA